MNLKQLLKTFCFHFVLIYGLTMIATFFWCLAEGDTSVPLDFFWKAMIFSLLADLPLFAFYSRKELTSRRYLFRIILHGCLLEIVLPAAGWFIGMWRGVGGYFVFFFTVLAVDGGMFALTYLKASIDAGSINSALDERKREKEKRETEDDDGQDNRDSELK